MIRKAFFNVLKSRIKENLESIILHLIAIILILGGAILFGYSGYYMTIEKTTNYTQIEIDNFTSLANDMQKAYNESKNKNEITDTNFKISFSPNDSSKGTLTYNSSTQKIEQSENSKGNRIVNTIIFALIGGCTGALLLCIVFILRILFYDKFVKIQSSIQRFERDVDSELEKMMDLKNSEKAR